MAKLTDPPTPASGEPPAPGTVRPTEQLETTPMPVSASAAASGGATGLGRATNLAGTSARATPRGNLTIFRRHPVATGLVAGIFAVLLVSSLTAWGVGAAVTASLTNQAAPVTPQSTLSTATPAPAAPGRPGGQLAAGQIALRATIQNIDDSTWTILTRRGQTVTITVNGSTQFGTKRMPQTQGSFAVGDNVIILATDQNDDAIAVRMISSAGIGATPTASPSSSATT